MICVVVFVCLWNRRPPSSTRTDTRVPYTTLFRSMEQSGGVKQALRRLRPAEQTAVQRRPPNVWPECLAAMFWRRSCGSGSVRRGGRESGGRPQAMIPGPRLLAADYWVGTVGSLGAPGAGGAPAPPGIEARSEERREGTACVITGRSRGSRYL